MFFSCTSVAWVLTKYEYEYEFCDNFITRVQSNMAIGSIAVLPPLAMFNAFVPRMRWRGTFVTHRYVAIGRYNYVKRAPPSYVWSGSYLKLVVTWPTRFSYPKRHLDRFSHFCTAHPSVQHTDTHTDTHSQTTPRATSVAIGRIYALRK